MNFEHGPAENVPAEKKESHEGFRVIGQHEDTALTFEVEFDGDLYTVSHIELFGRRGYSGIKKGKSGEEDVELAAHDVEILFQRAMRIQYPPEGSPQQQAEEAQE